MLQALEMGLWMWSFAYYVYPAVLLGIILIGSVLSGNAIYSQRKRLTAAFEQAHMVPVVRKGYVRAASSKQLVPGDVLVVQQGMAMCDLVLLRGSCLAEESVLTGEVSFCSCMLDALAEMTTCTLMPGPVHQHCMCDALEICIFFALIIANKVA